MSISSGNPWCIILNPAAKGDQARKTLDRVKTLAPEAKIYLTEQAGDGERRAREAVAEGYHTIVAAGGDGTMNEVLNGIDPGKCTLGILPVGTMNVFATELGIPMGSLSKAWKIIDAGHIRSIDLAKANSGYFVQLAGIGLDAEVVRQTTPDSKKALGPVSYLLTLAQVAARKPPRITIQTPEHKDREGSFVLVGNGRFYGGPFTMFKDAKLDDGLLDVMVFQNQSHWDIFRYMQAILFGAHPELPDVEYFQTRKLKLTATDFVPVEVDGELVGELPHTFGFSRKKLKVLVPEADRPKQATSRE
jgi:YegS/Rv2252/BmrU family lipid kinase